MKFYNLTILKHRCRPVFIFIILQLLFLSFVSQTFAQEYRIPLKAVNGVLDLRDWNFEKDGPIKLDGEWEFYWQQLLRYGDFFKSSPPKRTGMFQVPGIWTGLEVEGEKIGEGGDGYATFSLKVLLPEKAEQYTMKIGVQLTAYSLSVNGETVAFAGNTGKIVSESIPGYSPGVFPLSGHSNQLDFILRVSNFHYRMGGPIRSILLGQRADINKAFVISIGIELALMGAFLAMGIYHLGLYSLRKKDKSTLWFGLFCLLILLRTASTGERVITHVFSNFDWALLVRIEYISIYLFFPCCSLFFDTFFPGLVSKRILKVSVLLGIVFSIIVAVTSPKLFTKTIGVYQVIMLLSMVYYYYILVRAIIKKEDGSIVFALGAAVFAVTGINDILYAKMIINTGYYANIGFFMFVMSQAYILSKRFSHTYTMFEDLSENLEKKVTLRTQELKIAKEKSEIANRVKSEFIANMSHELRTPMNAILGFSDLLYSMVIDKKQKEYLHCIQTGGESLLKLINDILDLSKVESGKMQIQVQPTNLINLVEDAATIFSLNLSQKRLNLIKEIDGDLSPSLLLDPIRIRQILLNLIGNAVKFTTEGHIKVVIKQEQRKGSEVDLTIAVEDTGIGVPKNEQDKIFESFQQQEGQDFGKYGGSGLGLTICKRLIEQMGGVLNLKSEVGKGSVFEVRLNRVPISPLTELIESEGLQFTNDVRFKPATVLIADDVQSNRKLMMEVFKNTGIKAMVVKNGQDALLFAEEFSPDLILMDLKMPVLNGYDTVRLLKSNDKTRQIPVFAVSAGITESEEELQKKYGFAGYLSKPVSTDKLFWRLSQYLDVDSSRKERYPSQTHDQSGESIPLTLESLKDLSGEWKTSMKLAISQVDPDKMTELVAQAREQNSNFADAIQQRLDRFEYEKILELLFPDQAESR